jgi:antitoxin component of MazEF toxin-antitoxin module
MLTVRVRNKHQVTLPTSIMQQANLHQDDILEASYHNGVIILIPSRATPKQDNLMDYAGIGRTSYGQTPTEVDNTLTTLRSEWER